MPEITQNQTPVRKLPRRKKNKETHNAVERHRKEKINSGINRIGDLLPCSQALKQSKNMILGEAYRYITALKLQNDEMLLNGGDKVQAEEIRHLRKQMEDLRKECAHYIELLKANGINFLDDPTVHWKGKQRCAKVAKVTPTHLLSKGIIVYSNGNTGCSGKQPSQPNLPQQEKTATAIIVEQPCNIRPVIPNGAQMNNVTVSSAAPQIPVATLIPAVPKIGLTVVDQQTALAPIAPKPPSVNYITLQGLEPQTAVTTCIHQQTQLTATAPMVACNASASLHTQEESATGLTSTPQCVENRSLVLDSAPVFCQSGEVRSISTLPATSALLKASAGNTQTTWTTLHLTGNTVQPVCQTLPNSVSGPCPQPLSSVCSVQPVPVQLQTKIIPQSQVPVPVNVPLYSSMQRPTQLQPSILPPLESTVLPQSNLLSHPAIVSQANPVVLTQASNITQSAVVPQQPIAVLSQPTMQPQTAVVPLMHPTTARLQQPTPQPAFLSQPQTAILPQSGVLSQSVIPPQPQPAILPRAPNMPQPSHPIVPQPPHPIVPQLQPAIVPQAQSAGSSQPQTAVLPLLQTMQVLQVNSAGTSVAAAPDSQSSNNPNVVILQQANPCPSQQVIREDIGSQPPCQHIVIIQTSNQTPLQQTAQTGVMATPVPILPNQMATSVAPPATSNQAVASKQLVHILPRPSAQTPQTISMNGQVFVLQPVNSPDKGSTKNGQVKTQLAHGASNEESNASFTLHGVSAFGNIGQNNLQVSSQSNTQAQAVTPSSYTLVQNIVPPTGSAVITSPARQASSPCATPVLPKSVSSAAVSLKKAASKQVRKCRSARRKDPKQNHRIVTIAAKPASVPLQNKQSQLDDQSNVTSNHKETTSDSASAIAVTNVNCVLSTHTVATDNCESNITAVSSVSLPLNGSTGVNSAVNSTNPSIIATDCVSSVPAVNGASSVIAATATSVSTSLAEVTALHISSSLNSTDISSISLKQKSQSDSKEIERQNVTVNSTINKGVMLPSSTAVSRVDSNVRPSAANADRVPPCDTDLFSQNKSFNNDRSINIKKAEMCYSSMQSIDSTQNKLLVAVSCSLQAQPTVSNVSATENGPKSSSQIRQSTSHYQNKPPNMQDSSTNCPKSIFASSPLCSSSSLSTPSVTTSVGLTSETDKLDILCRSQSHLQDIGMSSAQISSADLKLAKEKAVESVGKENVAAHAFPRKDSTLSQHVYSLEHEAMEQSHASNIQTDSPLSAGGRGFSVASLLPTGHNINASTNSFGTFTSEQAELLALVSAWDHPAKSQPNSSNKERQQLKLPKQLDLTVAHTLGPIRGPPTEAAASVPTGTRPPQSASYSQSQSTAVGSLNVNNLIRPSSNQPYPGSPSLSQQCSVSSPGAGAVLVSQPSTPGLPNCPGSGQLNEYAPLKNALMRPHGSIGIGERHMKDMPKRPAQEDVLLPGSKRPKACPPSSRMDVKGPDSSQMMSQITPSSSAVMTQINPDGVGAFSSNAFINTVLRPTEGHCTPQVIPQEQASVGLLQQGHSQHGTAQSQHLAGNPYQKHQHQDQQRHHLYQLHHHLTQSDQTQLHNIHQRTMQQDQHGHKKRSLVRGSQGGPPVGLQQKHHLEKGGVQQPPPQQQQHPQLQQQPPPHQQQQHPQHQQQPTQQHPQHQQQQAHQQQTQHQQQQQTHQQQQQTHQQTPHQQQHQQASHQQQQTHQQQSHQLQQPPHQHQHHHQQHHHTQQQSQQLQQQQQQIQQQNSHSCHQHLQQQVQQQHFGGRHQEKNCEVQSVGPRAHQNNHLGQQECQTGQDHSAMQRLMGARNLEQQLTSQASNVPRSSDLNCAPSRQERHRLSSYSAEALIGKTTSSGEQRMGLHLQGPRGTTQDQPDLRGYLEASRSKGNIGHNPPGRLPPDHPGSTDVQRISDCPPFKALNSNHQLANFEVQVSRAGDNNKSVTPIQRGPQVQGGFRMGTGPVGDGRSRVSYSGTHPGTQGMQIGTSLQRDQEGCQSFMQSLLAPHVSEQNGHQRSTQCCPPVSIEYNCVPGTSAGDLQAKASSPSLPSTQKAPAMRLGEGNKGHLSQVSGNLHGQVVRAGHPHPATSHSSSEPGRNPAPTRPLSAVSQRNRHIGQDAQSSKIRPGDRPRSGAVRPGNPFDSEGPLPLSSGGVILGRPQTGETRRSSIVRFMPESTQVGGENNLVSDQHLSQNFSFPFIADGSMNPPPINANSTFIPPVTQPSASRTPALLPVEPQNTLPSFYPSYSPAAHPSLSSDIPLQYFSSQIFTSPSTDKSTTAPLNNRFSSILSPPRPVGFAQASFPLLPDMPPMPIGNSSGITPHLSNFNLTSLFPEIATAMPPDGSSMPMSPLLSLANTSSSDSSKQTNRPAHNISHILGHDGSSAV
ncbi:basic helix-loop-helix domain-containing protein USF3 [Denticeps clupeoides]|uniref:BHLH domain-containing protein n=1 Tax=Denticeps clupeoides TaxID=299321 RepID=A0AAY4AVF2_9TELE|nr:basic helix-loop-helix domain-containing protein USF3 [Denticeps clupeoides]